jgi:hypothetical protein
VGRFGLDYCIWTNDEPRLCGYHAIDRDLSGFNCSARLGSRGKQPPFHQLNVQPIVMAQLFHAPP